MALWLHLAALALMIVGLASAAGSPRGWPGMTPHLIATVAMLDSLSSAPLLAPVWWLVAVIAVTVGTAVHHRVRYRRRAEPVHSAAMAAGHCATLIMCVLMLPPSFEAAHVTAHHGGASSASALFALFAWLGVGCGIVCFVNSAMSMRGGPALRAIVETAAAGGSVVAMSLLELLSI